MQYKIFEELIEKGIVMGYLLDIIQEGNHYNVALLDNLNKISQKYRDILTEHFYLAQEL